MRWILAGALLGAALAGCEGRISSPLPVDGPGAGHAPGGDDGQGGGPGRTPTRLDCSAGPYASSSSMRRLSQAQYENAIRDIFDGEVTASRQYPVAVGRSYTGFSTEPELNEFAEQDVISVMNAAEEVALDVADVLGKLLPCASTDPGASCLDRYIDRYARRAYRRSVTDAERAVLHGIQGNAVAGGASFGDSVAIMTAAMLQMPQFLYVVEDAAPTARPLTGVELASRLSFFLWDSIPDDALLEAAESGALDTVDGVATQARRLLADSRADAAIVRFFREWTGTEQVSPADKSAQMYPFFDNAFAASMNESFDRFVIGALRDGADLRMLLVTPEVHVDASMASFFGVPPPESGWQKVSLDPARQSGIMTQPAMLASLAHTTDPSYVYRGRFIRRRLLCQPIGSPPADAQAQFSALKMPENPTAREASTVVRSNPTCAACHDLMDPGGLAFEHFDALGKWREGYTSGKSIETADTLPKVDGHSVSFSDHAAMLAALADEELTQHCFVEQVFRFAMSRLETRADGCSVQGMTDAFEAAGHVIETPFLSVATSDSFRYLKDAE